LTIGKTDRAIEIFPPIGETLRQSVIADRDPSGSTTDVQRCGLVHCCLLRLVGRFGSR
jgi:hypothetical protein